MKFNPIECTSSDIPPQTRVNNETQLGYLVLADISGYTSYLAGTELDHARDVLTELLELIVQKFKPTLEISKLEGDAVFAYIPHTRIPRDELLLELQESTYVAFRDRVEIIRRQTTCQCKACKAIPSLDLKFITHFGEYILQNVSGITELVGSDVNLVHRLLKNRVSEATGWKAYVLFSEAALAQMDLELKELHELVEGYEHLGEITTYSLDLRARYKALVEARRVFISPEEADWSLSRTFSVPPPVVWDWMNDPQKRRLWENYEEIRPLIRPGGRLGAGARNHCAHGKNVILETILDWRPFEYYTNEYPIGVITNHFETLPNGTRVNIHLKLKAPLPRWLKRLLAPLMGRMIGMEGQLDTLVRLIENS